MPCKLTNQSGRNYATVFYYVSALQIDQSEQEKQGHGLKILICHSDLQINQPEQEKLGHRMTLTMSLWPALMPA